MKAVSQERSPCGNTNASSRWQPTLPSMVHAWLVPSVGQPHSLAKRGATTLHCQAWRGNHIALPSMDESEGRDRGNHTLPCQAWMKGRGGTVATIPLPCQAWSKARAFQSFLLALPIGCTRWVLPSTAVGSFRDPSGISIIFSFITHGTC